MFIEYSEGVYNTRALIENMSTHCYVYLFSSPQNAFANIWDLILQKKGGGIEKKNPPPTKQTTTKTPKQPQKEVEVEIVVLRRW